jgi:hypothetical protein
VTLVFSLAGCRCGSAGVGEPCRLNADCDPGLYCAAGSQVCTPPPGASDGGGGGTDAAGPGTDAAGGGTDAAAPGSDATMQGTDANGGGTDAAPPGTDAAMAFCGDGACDAGAGESCSTCPGDCGACPPTCPNGACDSGETCATCAADCGACPPMCPNGACETGETCASCAADCGACPPVCPNGSCEAGETCTSCAVDCGACPPACPNGVCEAGETCSTCAADCGTCPSPCPQNEGTLACGATVMGNNAMLGSTDLNDMYSCAGWMNTGSEVAYTFIAATSGDVTFDLTALTADLDLFVLSGAPACGPTSCVAVSGAGGFTPESVTVAVTAGETYYVLADGYGAATTSDFMLTATCAFPVPTGTGTCADPFVIAASTGGYLVDDRDLCGQVSDSSAPSLSDCTGAGNGPDVVYRLDLATGGDVSLDLWDNTGLAAIDVVLYLRSSCASSMPGDQLACSNDITLQPRHAHIDTTLAAGSYYVVVDESDYVDGVGQTWSCGVVELTVIVN